ncbi:LysR family transcriptional regulator [Oscillibacter valericigenes]|nr:LysR family transcriptional regulator [Oscillibacter valericigenes]
MESKKLEALLMAVDLGSFTKAAEVLGYTQSGLTHMMNSLEKEVGFTLLERGRSGVRLTEEGERIAPAVREFLQANARLDSVIEQVASSRTEVIRVSAYASIAMHWLPAIIQRFREECPDVDVDIRMADHVDVPYELLAQGKMDAILVSAQDDGQYEWVHLANDTMFAVLPKNFDTQGMDTFPLAAFEGRDFIMPSQGFDKDIMRIFNRIGVKPHILPTWVDDPTVLSMVSHGLGVSMMTELTVRGRTDGVKLLPVEPASARELGLAVRSLDTASEGLRHFIDCTRRVVAEMQSGCKSNL